MAEETVRSRFRKVLAGERPADRLPIIEWAPWWNLTVERWQGEDVPAGLDLHGVKRFFGLDMDYQLWFTVADPRIPEREMPAGEGPGGTEARYEEILPLLYPDPVPIDRALWRRRAAEAERGEAVIWVTFLGFFWWPRVLFGIEPHLYAFYDQPALMHRMNRDLLAYHLRCLDAITAICTPDFLTFAEDMSYNHGPMISQELFEEFLAPYYRELIPQVKARGITPIIDSDGDIEPLIPWFEGVGLEGILPLERMAGVDVNRIRANHPTWRMIGGFDKTVMHLGEARMREEFERLLPALRSGYYIPSVDHQTPPAVSTNDYRLYLRLLHEYAEKACL